MCHVGADTQTPCQVASNGNPKTNAERATFVSRKNAAGSLGHRVVCTKSATPYQACRREGGLTFLVQSIGAVSVDCDDWPAAGATATGRAR